MYTIDVPYRENGNAFNFRANHGGGNIVSKLGNPIREITTKIERDFRNSFQQIENLRTVFGCELNLVKRYLRL